MSVLLETTLGELVIDLETDRIPVNARNFIAHALVKNFNNLAISTIDENFLCVFGPADVALDAGTAEYVLSGGARGPKFLAPERHERVKHSKMGTVAMVNRGQSFYITLRDGSLDHLDKQLGPSAPTIIGYVEEGLDVLEKISQTLCDTQQRPYNPIRIRHAIVLDDAGMEKAERPLWFPKELPLSPPEIIDELLQAVDAEEDERLLREREKEAVAKAQEVELELMGDIPSADIRPPNNVLFVCQLNPVTEDEDLKTVFARFGEIEKCEIIRDYKTGDSLQYAFVEFKQETSCNKAYVGMQNVLIDDKRIKVDFSQSVSKVWNKYRREGQKQRSQPHAVKNETRSRSRSRKDENRPDRGYERKDRRDDRHDRDEYRGSRAGRRRSRTTSRSPRRESRRSDRRDDRRDDHRGGRDDYRSSRYR